jgi:hypothetical protein
MLLAIEGSGAEQIDRITRRFMGKMKRYFLKEGTFDEG